MIENAVNELSMCGYWPIIAHIERYACMHEKGAAQYISSLGAYLQMNAGYIMNAKFKDSRFISKLFKEGLISFVASDSHNITSRAPNLGECADFLNKKYSSELTETLLIHNPQKIINKQRRDNGKDKFDINIYVERDSQKGIVIGKNGKMLKEIGTEARREIEILLNKEIYLNLWVKVKEDWRKKKPFLKELGYFAED